MVVKASHPTDWVTLPISAIVRNIIDHRGRTPRKLGTKWGGDIPALSANNVKMGYIDLEEGIHYGTEVLYERWMTNGKTVQGDLIITVEAPLGNVALIPDNRKYIVSQRTVVLQTRPDLVANEFLLHFMMSGYFQGILKQNSTGSTAIGIRRKKLETLEVKFPSLPEQRAIATALSDADAFIEAVKQLLAKKRQIKQGAMSELLTGKRRLAGFEKKIGYKQTDVGVIPNDWEVNPIGDLFSISVGRDLREEEYSTSQDATFKYPVFSNTVSNEGIYGFYNFPEYNGESLTIVGRGVGLGRAFKRSDGFGAIGRLLVLFPKENVNPSFATEYINHRVKIFTESGGIPQLTGISIAKYRIPLPPTITEQTAIAEVLSDMDAEIAALEAKLAKARLVKQGMMSMLLTGRARLV